MATTVYTYTHVYVLVRWYYCPSGQINHGPPTVKHWQLNDGHDPFSQHAFLVTVRHNENCVRVARWYALKLKSKFG
jgi:hypothetical protein